MSPIIPPAPFDTFNAKRLSAVEVARTFVMPAYFPSLAGKDHCYIIGPRGSGKTTLLKMLTGPSLMCWTGKGSESIRQAVDYSSIFLPADELWARQSDEATAVGASTTQILYAFIETIVYRTAALDTHGNEVHYDVSMSHDEEVDFCRLCIAAWGLGNATPSFAGLLNALDLMLLNVSSSRLSSEDPVIAANPLSLLSFGIKAFNRAVNQPDHQWALLLDEMELAPQEIHSAVVAFVRGGTSNLILKMSMSPFDRYMHGAVPGHDFQTVYLSGQNFTEIKALTSGLWYEGLRARGLPPTRLDEALPTQPSRGRPNPYSDRTGFLAYMTARDHSFASWLSSHRIDINKLDELSYNEQSATIRKVLPLLVFRDALLGYRDGKPFRRSRKKSYEPFTGASAVTKVLEGNPRWIKVAFAHMLNFYDTSTGTVGPGFQIDSIVNLSNRFESLLRVLPKRQAAGTGEIAVHTLVDTIADYMHNANTGAFKSDPVNCFTVDSGVPSAVIDALVMGLYAGAFVQVRNRRSPAVLSNFDNERFRLAYLLGVRERREFPLRLGKDVALSEILRAKRRSPATPSGVQLGLDL